MNYYWQRNDEIESTDEPGIAAPIHRSPVSIASDAYDVIEMQTEDQVKKIYFKSEDARLTLANGIIARHTARGWTEAQAQLYALTLLQAVNAEFMRRAYLNDFSEKMREQLIQKIGSFDVKAYPLTEKQFVAAVKGAW